MGNPAPGFRNHPEHKVLLDTGPDPVTVLAGEAIVAMTTQALIMREDNHPVRAYVPVGDIIATLSPTELTTYCPYKGDTVYFDVTVGGEVFHNSAWSYDHPFDEMKALAGHVAFDDRFTIKIG